MTARALADSFRKFSASAATVALAWHVGEHVRMEPVGKCSLTVSAQRQGGAYNEHHAKRSKVGSPNARVDNDHL
jgi:hypothetical protein